MPREIIGKGVLHEGCKALLYGEKKLGKSMLVCQLCLAIRYGLDWLTFPTSRGINTLYLQGEIKDAMLWRRMDKMDAVMRANPAANKQAEFTIWNLTKERIKLDTEDGARALYHELELWKPDLCVIDPLYKFISRPGDPDCVIQWQDNVDLASELYGTAFIIVAHPRKPAPGEEASEHSSDFYGPTWYTAWTDATIKLARPGKDAPVDSRMLYITDTRNAEDTIPHVRLRFNRNTLLFEETIGF